MTTNAIRLKFLNFFKSKGHAIVRSDSLVPKDDPTVLFTTAGMQQFKPQFLGQNLIYTRATTCQKCLRTDDLDCVGKTDFHHTFFEMLGNFSFGDYFKKEAIEWAWEFLTVEMKLPKERLWVSVYMDDDEAYSYWLNAIKIPSDRLVKLGDKSNFWPSNARLNGPNGPCGPCSEIFYDYGVNPNCPKGKDCDPDCSCGRFSEVWNLVFTQYNRKDGGVLESLPAKNIDTGMGLERLAAVVQGKKSNYETDNFSAILSTVKSTLKEQGVNLSESENRIIADHMRAVTIGITDGVIPSNEGRGYVMRKLIVDMTDLAVRGGAQKPLIYSLVDIVIKVMSGGYPELTDKAEEIKVIIKRIEEAFIKIRREKIPELKDRIAKTTGDADALGDVFFLFRDTHGLTRSTINGVAQEVGVPAAVLDGAFGVFEAKMEAQKNRSRASSKMTGDVFTDGNIKLDVPKTEFVGYSVMVADVKILKIIKRDERLQVVIDRTPFYAESGGQVGDTGSITGKHGSVKVVDTQKFNDIYIHDCVPVEGEIKEGESVKAHVDEKRRLAIMRNHSATHILQAALREVLGAHIKQQGSLVNEERLRFDFTHPTGIKPQDIESIEERVNACVLNCEVVSKEVLPIEEAKKKGALAYFAEKYGDEVRIVSMGDYSKEFCGGTHLDYTGQIGGFKVVSEGSVAQGIRRIEAVTGFAVPAYLKEQSINAQTQIQQQALRVKTLEKEIENLRFENIKGQIDSIVQSGIGVNGFILVAHVFNNVDMSILRKLSDLLKQKQPSGIFVLGAKTATDASMIIAVTDDLVARGIKANEIIAKVAPLFGANGGGRPQMAQAGSKDPQKLDGAVAQAKDLVRAIN